MKQTTSKDAQPLKQSRINGLEKPVAKLQQAALPPSGPNGKFVDENSGAPLVSKTINHSCEPVATSTQEHLSR